jgi:F-type H+-transporting ATPase subunit c
MKAATTTSTPTDLSLSRRVTCRESPDGAPRKNQKNKTHMIIAEITGSLPAAVGCFAAAIGVGLVGAKAVESVGRNPDASGKILVQSILGMALAEAVAFYAIFLAK